MNDLRFEFCLDVKTNAFFQTLARDKAIGCDSASLLTSCKCATSLDSIFSEKIFRPPFFDFEGNELIPTRRFSPELRIPVVYKLVRSTRGNDPMKNWHAAGMHYEISYTSTLLYVLCLKFSNLLFVCLMDLRFAS